MWISLIISDIIIIDFRDLIPIIENMKKTEYIKPVEAIVDDIMEDTTEELIRTQGLCEAFGYLSETKKSVLNMRCKNIILKAISRNQIV